MSIRRLAGSSALVLFLAAPAFAEVTPQQVWEDWQAFATSSGQTITTESVEQDGDTLVVTNMTIAVAQEGVDVNGTIAEVRFKDNGDGTVTVTMSDEYPMDMTITPPEGEGGEGPTTFTLLISQPGTTIIASGDEAETTYDFTSPSLRMALTGVEGVDVEAVDTTAELALVNTTGKYILTPGETGTSGLNSSFAADAMTITFSGTNPDPSPAEGEEAAPSSAKFTMTMADITGTTNGSFLGGAAAMADLATALKAGMASEGTITTGATTYDMEVTEATGVTKISGKSDTNSIGFSMDAEKISYSGGATGATLTMTSPDIPFPQLNLGYAEAAFNFLMPVGPNETPADFALLTKIVDLTISEEIWGLIDPTAQLPRDPATLVIDTKGTAKLTANLMDPAAMEALGDTAPGELHSLDITELRAKIAGAELTGAGALTFDNTDLVTYGGMPAPTGKIDLKLVGGNGLMDKLVAIGLLPEDQVMGFRMMLSMFANATGEDELTSTLEFKDGGFFANGQQLQ